MREIADKARIEAFLAALAREATAERVTYHHYDFTAQALAKIERGHTRDLADVEAMRTRGLITGAEVRRQFALVEPQLYRFPAIDPPSFRRAVDAIFPP